MSHVKKANAAQCTDQEDDIKPAMVEVELEVTKDFCNDGPRKNHTVPEYFLLIA